MNPMALCLARRYLYPLDEIAFLLPLLLRSIKALGLLDGKDTL